MEELKLNELIKLESLPKIYSQLEEIGKWVDEGLAKLDLGNLVIDEEHKQEIKKSRSEINNISKVLEDRRKEIKKTILEPYELFETKYNEEVKSKLSNASETLGNAIDIIESKQKQEKEETLRQFFENYKEDAHLEDIINFEDVGLNITLSASEKSLKEQIVDFVKKVSDDFQAISSCEDREEILLEYKRNGFNYSQAVNTINTKKEAIKSLQEKLEQTKEIQNEEQEVVKVVDTLVSKPVEVVNSEPEQITCTFTVVATLDKIKKLKDFLKEEGIDYQ